MTVSGTTDDDLKHMKDIWSLKGVKDFGDLLEWIDNMRRHCGMPPLQRYQSRPQDSRQSRIDALPEAWQNFVGVWQTLDVAIRRLQDAKPTEFSACVEEIDVARAKMDSTIEAAVNNYWAVQSGHLS